MTNLIQFGAKSIGKMSLQSKFGSTRFRQDFSLCAGNAKAGFVVYVLPTKIMTCRKNTNYIMSREPEPVENAAKLT